MDTTLIITIGVGVIGFMAGYNYCYKRNIVHELLILSTALVDFLEGEITEEELRRRAEETKKK